MITTTRTFCRFCHAACPVEVDVDTDDADGAGTVVGVRGDAADPLFGAYTCIKGRHLGDQHHHPDRLRTALKRRPDRGFDEVPTEQALDEVAERLTTILADGDPRAVASYCGTATFQNAAAHPVARAFHQAIASPSFYTSITIDQPAKLVNPLRLGSWAAGPQPWSTADVSLLVGINVVVSMLGLPGGPTFVNPLASLRAAKRRGLQLIVIDPRRTETATMADLHLQVRAGRGPDAAGRHVAGHPRRGPGRRRVLRPLGRRPRRAAPRRAPVRPRPRRRPHRRGRRRHRPGGPNVRRRPPWLGDVRHGTEHGAARHADGAPRGVLQRGVRALPAAGRAGPEHDGRARPDR